MAKSKQQKQQEAIERLRAKMSEYRQEYLRMQAGGLFYKDHEARYGTKYAQKKASEAGILFKKRCQEAQVDHYGNPFKKSIS